MRFLPLTVGLMSLVCWSLDASAAWADTRDTATQDEAAADAAVPDPIPIEFRLERPWQSGPQCGGTACFVLLRMLNVDCDFEAVTRCVPTGQKGASLTDLKTALAAWGVSAEVVRTTPDGLRQVEFPCIVHQAFDDLPERGHFFVLCGRSGEKLAAIDGTSSAFFYLDPDVFERSWSGYLLIPKKPVGDTVLRSLLYGLVLATVVCLVMRVVRQKGRRLPADAPKDSSERSSEILTHGPSSGGI